MSSLVTARVDTTGRTASPSSSRTRIGTRIGWALTVLTVAFLVFDVVGKLLRPAAVVEATARLGFGAHQILPIGILLAVGVVLLCIPRTTFLGAVYLTAYLGGAVCANFRTELPVAGYVLSPVYVALVLWGGLFLRSARLRALVIAGR